MNIELKLNYEEDGQQKSFAMGMEVSGERESSYSLQTPVGDVLVNFRPKSQTSSLTEQFEPRKVDTGFPDFNDELRKKMEQRNVFSPKRRSRK